MVAILQSKDTDWKVALKNKTQPFVVHRKCTSLKGQK
jgi:hypothetical protein